MFRFALVAAPCAIAVTTAGAQAPRGVQSEGPPATSDTDHRLRVPYTEFTLANGLHVILHRDSSVPVVSVNVWYHVGSANEHPGRTGFAHLFEHLMFEGSKNVREGAFDEWLEAAGGNNNGSTANDRTNYYIDVPSNALELALFLESDRMGYLLEPMSHDRLNGRPFCRELRRRGEFLQDLLRAEQRKPRHRGRYRHRRHSSARRKMVCRNPARRGSSTDCAARSHHERHRQGDHDRSRPVATFVPRVAHAGDLRAQRRGDGRCLEPADRRQKRATV